MNYESVCVCVDSLYSAGNPVKVVKIFLTLWCGVSGQLRSTSGSQHNAGTSSGACAADNKISRPQARKYARRRWPSAVQGPK